MKTGLQASDYMKQLHKTGATGVRGWCLRTCRTAWGLGGDEMSAIKEWNSIPADKKSLKWWKAPVGAPHFWAVGANGHVALQSRVKGIVWSTDAPVSDKVGPVSIKWFAKHWRAHYLGWSTEFQNKNLPLKENK